IFLPAAGYRVSGGLYDAGSCGYFWSSSLDTGYPYLAQFVNFYSGDVDNIDGNYRYYGYSVRAVCLVCLAK
ncbi:MAG: hypothetical protein J6W49_05815, partial [Paludibacteraceae bacterium]|nr:hypothetical protein [Paludibacteraceae bacterium]